MCSGYPRLRQSTRQLRPRLHTRGLRFVESQAARRRDEAEAGPAPDARVWSCARLLSAPCPNAAVGMITP